MTLHSIGPFTLDTRTLLLLREGEIVKIPMKTVEVLLALLNRQGEIATKDELLKAVWPDSIVEEANLTVHVALLRKPWERPPPSRPSPSGAIACSRRRPRPPRRRRPNDRAGRRCCAAGISGTSSPGPLSNARPRSSKKGCGSTPARATRIPDSATPGSCRACSASTPIARCSAPRASTGKGRPSSRPLGGRAGLLRLLPALRPVRLQGRGGGARAGAGPRPRAGGAAPVVRPLPRAAPGDTLRALAAAKEATTLDPISLKVVVGSGFHLYLSQQYEPDLDPLLRALELEPEFAVALWALGLACDQLRRFEQAEAAHRSAVLHSGGSAAMESNLARSLALAGKRSEAAALLERLRFEGLAPYRVATIEIALGENARAIASIERAFAIKDPWLVVLKVDPMLEPIRPDRRIVAIQKEVLIG